MHMFIIYNHEMLHNIYGATSVRFTDDDGLKSQLDHNDYLLGRGIFINDLPSANLVEHYTKRADLTGPGEHGNDYVFVNAWCAPKRRDQKLNEIYRATTP